MSDEPPTKRRLTIYTEEDIEAFLSGDRRVIDRLLLHGLNNLGAALIEHAEREEALFASMGDAEIIKKRSDWIDSQIDRAKTRTDMMNKVATSTWAWALIGFLAYLGTIAKDACVVWWKSRGHS